MLTVPSLKIAKEFLRAKRFLQSKKEKLLETVALLPSHGRQTPASTNSQSYS
jgi:hypothetical protein